MSAEITTLILPGGNAAELPLTVSSIRQELGEDADLRILSGADSAGDAAAAGIAVTTGAEMAGSERILAFARAGDRFIPGALEARLRTFTAYPDIGISIAGHVILTADGHEVRRAGPPVPGSDAEEILIRRAAEAAAVLARAAALDEGHFELLTRPFGDIVVWSRVARDSGYHCSGEFAAEIRLDPDRHGQSGAAWLGPLIESVGSAEGPDQAGDSVARRELLRRLYLAPEEHGEPIDLAALFAGKLGTSEAAAAVIADLQWIAERQSEALELERLRWAEGRVDERHIPPLTVSEEILEAQAKLSESGVRIGQLHNAVRRLEAEVYRRDAIISDLENLTYAEAHHRGEAGRDAEAGR